MDTGRLRNIRGHEGGFSLIELMVALAVLSFGMLGVSAMFTTAIGGNAQGKHMTEATSLAQSRLDYLNTSAVYNNLEDAAGTESDIDPSAGGETVVPGIITPDGIYTRFTNVTAVWTNLPLPATKLDIKLITVEVSWVAKVAAGGNKTDVVRKVKMQTLRAKGL